MFKKQLNILMLLCMLTTLLSSGIKVQASESGSSANSNDIQTEFFVSPSGSDTNDGSNDHPFATLQAARDAVRLINSNMTGDIIVYVASGNYYVNKTISFDERDSGTNGHRVIYANKDGLGTAKFIGGNKVTSAWSAVTRTGADADLPASAAGSVYKTFVGTGINFNTLYVNDARAIMARTKNLTVDPRFPNASATYMRSAGGGVSTLNYNSGDIDSESMTGLLNAQTRGELDAQVYMWDGGYWDWMTDTIPIASVNTSSRTINYKTDPNNRAAYRPKYATRSDARYFLQGNLGFLDQPGEYYFNKKTGYLYYYPVTGSGNISNQDIVIPAVEKIIDIKGASRTSMVSHITFSGLEFKDTNFPDYYAYGWNWGDAGDGLGYYPPEAAGSTQPSYAEQSERVEFQVGIITLSNTNNITITNTHIKNAGMFGIELYLANQYTNINNSLIEYTGHGGINLEGGYPGVGGDANGDGYSRDNKVTNTIIHDLGQLVGQTSGITVNNSGYNTFSHLEIYNSPRRALFITGGPSRNSNVAFPNGDKNFNPMTDMYSHHNTFEYIYLHDAQQDGGDDGAFFSAYLWKGQTNYKPNYINQMVIDRVGANPSMTDIAPCGMSFDIGASGWELRNVKSVNTQHFNGQLSSTSKTGYNSKITLFNTNLELLIDATQAEPFDDSLIDYANIGVGADFPSVYQPVRTSFQEPNDIYFKDDFENGLDLSKWMYTGKKPNITTRWMSEGVLHGKKALEIVESNGFKPVLYRDFNTSLKKNVTVKFFDRQTTNLAWMNLSSIIKSLVRVDNGVHAVGMGIDTKVDNGHYVVLDGSTETATSVPRAYGWHEMKWDYTSGTNAKLYMDGVPVKTLNTITDFNRVQLGSDDGMGEIYYDQLYIYGGAVAPPTSPLPIQPAPIPGVIEAEDYDGMSGIQTEAPSETNYTNFYNAEGALTAPVLFEGTQLVGSINAGDWMDYKVNVPAAGTYKLNYRVAVDSGKTGEVQLQVNGVNLKTTSFPTTGGLRNWVTVSDLVTLEAGPQTIRLYATRDGWNLNWIQFKPRPQVPGIIEAEDYDAMSGIQTQPSDEGGVNVGWIDPGDWMDYILNVPADGIYTVKYRVAANGNTGGVQFMVNGVNKKTTAFPTTGGWQNWTTVSDTVSLAAGTQTVRLAVTGGGWNFNWFELVKVADRKLSSITSPAAITVDVGTAKTAAALGLPAKVTLVTDGGNVDANVTWDLSGTSYDPTVTTVQRFTVTGIVTLLPAGVLNPNNVPLTTSISVTTVKNKRISQSQMTATATSQETGGDNNAASMAIDGNPQTIWHTKWDKSDVLPQSITLNLGRNYKINKVAYLPRQSGGNGIITGYNVYVSTDGVTFTKVASGNWDNNSAEKYVTFTPTNASYVKLEATQGVNGWASAAEINVFEADDSKIITSISAPAAVTGVANGTAKTAAALGLPATVQVVTDAGNVNANVAWNVVGTSYDPAVKTAQTFTIPGTVTLPAEVVNPNNVALTTSITVTVNAGASVPQSTLTGLTQVNAGQAYEVTMGLSSVTQSVYQQMYALDLTLHYDPMSLQFDSVESLKNGFQVIDSKEAVPGHIRIIAARASENQDVLTEGDSLKFKFTVKSGAQATSTTISVGNVVIANGQGNELQVNGASRDIQISIPVTVDKSLLNATITNAQAKYDTAVEGNGDGLYAIGSKALLQSAIDAANAAANASNATQQQVDSAKTALEAAIQVFTSKKITADINGGGISIGDLASVAVAYGKQPGQSGWNEKADVNHDGKVDITDLAIVAKAILQ